MKRGLQNVRQDGNSRLHHKFEEKDWGVLFSIIQQHNPQYFHTLNVFESNSIMLANASLGLSTLAILQTLNLIERFTVLGLFVLTSELILFYLARKRSQIFHLWFYVGTFEASLAYGRSLKVMFRVLLLLQELQSASGEELRPFFGRTLMPSILDKALKGEL